MIELAEMRYAEKCPVWVVLVDGIVYQCCETEEAALRVVDELERGCTQ